MKKYVIILILAIINHSVSAQEIDTIYHFHKYEVTNPSMQYVLDKAIDTASSCPYFKLLNKKFYIIVDIDSNECSFRIYPHNVSMICFYKYDMKEFHVKDGLCYYKGCYIYLLDHTSDSVMEKFFSATNSIVDMFLDKTYNILETQTPFDYFFFLCFQYNDDLLINNEDRECENPWHKRRYFQYLVQNGDTWETIAAKCGCTMEALQKECSEYEHPIPGLVLCLRYIFDNDDNFQGMLQWYK